MIHIREIKISDAQAFLALGKKLDRETKFMMLEVGERNISMKEQEERIRELLNDKNSKILVAENGETLIGYIAATGGAYKRNAHKACIDIGVVQDYTGQGLGTSLFKELETWAKQAGLHRLELTVMKHNEGGIALYKKRGFTVEGEIADSLCVDGQFVNEYLMSKIIARNH